MTLSRNQKKNINLKILHKVTYRKLSVTQLLEMI